MKEELFAVPSPESLHQRISGQIVSLLRLYITENDLGELYNAPIDVHLSSENVVIPDILFISNEKHNIITEKYIDGAPDLIIEILSFNRKRDLVEKRELYELHGILEYLIIDPIEEEVTAYRFNKINKYFNKAKVISKGSYIEFNSISGLKMKVEKILNDFLIYYSIFSDLFCLNIIEKLFLNLEFRI
ncbi:MAG: Uma2 family endonuclease [Promethearchaeota archaeon]